MVWQGFYAVPGQHRGRLLDVLARRAVDDPRFAGMGVDELQNLVAGFLLGNDLTIINIVREIAAAFQDNQAPIPPDVIYGKLNIPAEFGYKILDHLVNSRLIVRTSEPEAGFLLATDPANIKLSDITEAIAATGFAQSGTDRSDSLQQIAQSQQSALAQYTLKQILNPKQDNAAPDNGKQDSTA